MKQVLLYVAFTLCFIVSCNPNQTSLVNGAQPYEYAYGMNLNCEENACNSFIEIKADAQNDVVVIVKKMNGLVAGHVYVQKGQTSKIGLVNGEYQTFFYSGQIWEPEQNMGNGIKGGFLENESFTKDDFTLLENARLSYSLTLISSGNLIVQQSSKEEMF